MAAAEIDKDLLEILACPENKEPVSLAEKKVVDKVNKAIKAGKVASRNGEDVTSAMDAGLVRQDGKVLYPIRGGIPIMLIDESILLDNLSG